MTDLETAIPWRQHCPYAYCPTCWTRMQCSAKFNKINEWHINWAKFIGRFICTKGLFVERAQKLHALWQSQIWHKTDLNHLVISQIFPISYTLKHQNVCRPTWTGKGKGHSLPSLHLIEKKQRTGFWLYLLPCKHVQLLWSFDSLLLISAFVNLWWSWWHFCLLVLSSFMAILLG